MRSVLEGVYRHLAEETSEVTTVAALRCAVVALEEAIQGLEKLEDCKRVKTKLKLAAV